MSAGVHPTPTRSTAGLRESVHREPAAPATDHGPVVVPESARFEGLLTFRGRARVEGEVEGEILCHGSLWVGETGRVVGTIEADELVVAGVLEGDATARKRVELTATARVQGTIRSPRLHLADGCVLEGRCETTPGPEPEPDLAGLPDPSRARAAVATA